MKLIRHADYQTMPWKNGLGTTREICSKRLGSRMAWRLSLAQVDADGAFSEFAGMERILTVVQGQGMRLVSPDQEYQARPFQPVAFSGGTQITGYCDSTPIENFNLIFDPALIDAQVRIADCSGPVDLAGRSVATTIIHVLQGQIVVADGSVLLAEDTCVLTTHVPTLTAHPDTRCAIVRLSARE